MIRIFILLAIMVAGAAFFVWPNKSLVIVSPAPKVFGSSTSEPKVNLPINRQSLSANKWFPTENFSASYNYSLNLSAKSAVSVDFDSGEILFNKDSREKLPIASVVKIMTALVALENSDPSRIFNVSEKAVKVGENSMGLVAGEKLEVRELLYGLMLVSGNDAAVTIAEGVSGSEEKFVNLMNEQVAYLGLKDTHFVNASGLDVDGINDYSTAYDVAVISRYVWEHYPLFRQVTSTYHEYIDSTNDHAAYDLYNDTNLLTTYPGVKGIKPGFTWEAGLCLATYAENGGKRVLAVVLGSDDRRGEMKELLDYSFGTYGIRVPHPGLDL